MKLHSPIGNGMALLSGTVPRIDDILDVEVDLDEIFSWGRNITASSGRTPSISVANGITQITAELIQGTDEECTALQFGDSILIIELDTPIAEKTGFVDVITTKVRLHPTNI
ncbi:hypothetical protein [Pseudomonas sp. S09G 359]|uniref:hypothetical protein n=1 Tax=Pseudomonas sp. S09G 359 TaxID=2054919 RepID=UPI0012FF507E|nr:hypothetical protein [Pseudomonas sp. S09G 359]